MGEYFYSNKKNNNMKNTLSKRDPIYHDVISFESLYQCAKLCLQNVTWKASVQSYEIDMLYWVGRLHKELSEGRYRSFGFTNFYINERGKTRHIQSVHISERTVQKSLEFIKEEQRIQIMEILLHLFSITLEIFQKMKYF